MGVCVSAPKAAEEHELGTRIDLKEKRAILGAQTLPPVEEQQLFPGAEHTGSDNLGRSQQSFLIKSEENRSASEASRSSYDATSSTMSKIYQAAISSDVSLATSIQEKRVESTPSGETVRSEGSLDETLSASQYDTLKGGSNASSLVTVSEEVPEPEDTPAEVPTDSREMLPGRQEAPSDIGVSGLVMIATTLAAGKQAVNLSAPDASDSTPIRSAAEPHPSVAPNAATQDSKLVKRNRLSTSEDAETSALITVAGLLADSVPFGPGWSAARAHLAAKANGSTDDMGLNNYTGKALPHHLAGKGKLSMPVRPAASRGKAHGFLAKVASLQQFQYMSPLPAFSDNRPTYSRDAQDDEPAASDSHGESFTLQLRTPRALSKPTLTGPAKSSRLGKGTGKHDMSYFASVSDAQDVSLMEAQPSACMEREAEAALRAWRETDEEACEGDACAKEGTSADKDMGSITGWQALADEILAEMEQEEDAEDVQAGEDADNISPLKASPSALMLAAGLASAPGSTAAKPMLTPEIEGLKASTEAQPGGTFFVQYEMKEELGEGAFGKVFKVRRRRDGKLFVAKIMHDNALTDKARVEAQNEVAVLASLDHPNVVKYYECFAERGTHVKIVMELCEDGDLDGFIKAQGGRLMSEDTIMLKFVQICLAVHYVHEKGLIHRDLKACNLLMSGDIVKLGDFGISRMLAAHENAAQTMVGTPYYMSPEILKGRGYGPKTDVWALGCILYELCCLRKAFEAPNIGSITVKIMSGKFPPIPSDYSSDLRLLVDALLKKDPDARPSMAEVMDLIFVRTHLKAYARYFRDKLSQLQPCSDFERSLLHYRLTEEDASGMLLTQTTEQDSYAARLDDADEMQSMQDGRSEHSSTSSALRKEQSPGSGEIFEQLRRQRVRAPSEQQATLSQALMDKENVDRLAKRKAEAAAQSGACGAARCAEEAEARKKLRAFAAAHVRDILQGRAHPWNSDMGQDMPSARQDSSRGAYNLPGSKQQQQQYQVMGASAQSSTGKGLGDAGARAKCSSAAGRKRRSSSFDAGGSWVPPAQQQQHQQHQQQLQQHRKTSSFDQQLIRSRSRFGPGLLAGDSGLAGNGAAEMQDDSWDAGTALEKTVSA